MRLDRMLQSQGFGTRKQCRALVEAGAVRIGDIIAEDWDADVDPDGLEFSVDGVPWRYRRRYRAQIYLALNKPPGIECSRRPSHHRGVLALLPDNFTLRGVQPVGRLDHDTTGLLLLSDDGAFIHALSHPKRHVPKIYVATTQAAVSAAVSEDFLARLRGGVPLADEPAPLRADAERLDTQNIEVVLEQGKYHQVKRMIAAAGNHCTALRRIAIGGLRLEDLGLASGEWCHLDAEQRARL